MSSTSTTSPLSKASAKAAEASSKASDTASKAADRDLTEVDVSGSVTKVNLAKPASSYIDKVDPLDKPIEGSSPLNLNSDPNYLTNFCKNRNTPNRLTLKNPFTLIDKAKIDTWIGLVVVGIPLFLFLLWCFFKNYDVIIPYAGGVFNILKFLIIYCLILFVLRLFFKFVFTFKFWVSLFIKYFELFLNPLRDNKVSSAYCYFTPYVNWLIYYPAKLYFFICLLGVCFIFFLIIIPVIVAISFTIGYLFSLLGDSSSLEKAAENLKKAVSSVKVNTAKPADFAKAPSILSSLSKAPAILSSLSKMDKVPDLVDSLSKGDTSKVPDLVDSLNKGDTSKVPSLLDSFKYKVLPAK